MLVCGKEQLRIRSKIEPALSRSFISESCAEILFLITTTPSKGPPSQHSYRKDGFAPFLSSYAVGKVPGETQWALPELVFPIALAFTRKAVVLKHDDFEEEEGRRWCGIDLVSERFLKLLEPLLVHLCTSSS